MTDKPEERAEVLEIVTDIIATAFTQSFSYLNTEKIEILEPKTDEVPEVAPDGQSKTTVCLEITLEQLPIDVKQSPSQLMFANAVDICEQATQSTDAIKRNGNCETPSIRNANDVTKRAEYGLNPACNSPSNKCNADVLSSQSVHSIGSLVCRICHNSENPEKLVSPCLCKGSLSYVHVHCLERWISTSRSTICELCQFQYNTEQTLRYSCFQSLRMWYGRSLSRRALQEDCQMFSLLTLVAFGIVGTLLVGIQYYSVQSRSMGLARIWTKSWLLFFLFTTLAVYSMNTYIIVRSQLAPWYRWWQSARDIKLILENRKPFTIGPTSGRADVVVPPATLSPQQRPVMADETTAMAVALPVTHPVPINRYHQGHGYKTIGSTLNEETLPTTSRAILGIGNSKTEVAAATMRLDPVQIENGRTPMMSTDGSISDDESPSVCLQ